jgi:hypothetical protein
MQINRLTSWTVKRYGNKPLIKRFGSMPIFFLFAVLCLAVINIKGLASQLMMEGVSRDCGWTEYKAGNQVDGLYLETVGYESWRGVSTDASFDAYPVVELNYNGEITRNLTHAKTGDGSLKIEHRTLRYGVRSRREHASPNIVRIENDLMDFDKEDVLAKEIKYDFIKEDDGLWSTKNLIYFFVNFHPAGCGRLSTSESTKRFMHVLQPISVP